jgi:hypothetical protein
MSEGLHKLEHEVEDALAAESAQNGYAQASTNLAPNNSTYPLESSNTTVAGSRNPTIKHTDSASDRSHDVHTGDEKSMGEKDHAYNAPEVDDTGLLTGFKLYSVFLSLMLSCFVSWLDLCSVRRL